MTQGLDGKVQASSAQDRLLWGQDREVIKAQAQDASEQWYKELSIPIRTEFKGLEGAYEDLRDLWGPGPQKAVMGKVGFGICDEAVLFSLSAFTRIRAVQHMERHLCLCTDLMELLTDIARVIDRRTT